MRVGRAFIRETTSARARARVCKIFETSPPDGANYLSSGYRRRRYIFRSLLYTRWKTFPSDYAIGTRR